MISETKLDIGCGVKKRLGFISVDPHPGFNADLVCTLDKVHLHYPYGSVDEIYCRRCLQHVPDDVAALREVSKLLRAGGRATIIVSGYRAWLYYHLWQKYTRYLYPCCHLYTKERLKRKLTKAGWSLAHKGGLSFTFVIYPTTEGCRRHSFDLEVKLFKLPVLDEVGR